MDLEDLCERVTVSDHGEPVIAAFACNESSRIIWFQNLFDKLS